MRKELRRDAEAGDPYACLALAYFYQTGKELDLDLGEAVMWYERAADHGCARAHWELSKMYRDGDIVRRNMGRSIRHLRASAELGNLDAQLTLADECYKGEEVPKDMAEFRKWITRAAEQGSCEAKFIMGYMLTHGIGVERSVSDGEIWFSSAALTGYADFFLDIGLRIEYGLNGLEKDLVEAARWYKYGVDMGHDKCILCWSSVMDILGGTEQETLESRQLRLRLTATQLEKEERERTIEDANDLLDAGEDEIAYDCYSYAAELGSSEAMFSKAMMRFHGIGTEMDDIGAMQDLSRAADMGSEDAMFFLAQAYESRRFPSDETQIVRLYADAAFNGFLAAYYYLSKYVDRPEIYVRRTHTRR